jgi:protein O-mannosyl-transferase
MMLKKKTNHTNSATGVSTKPATNTVKSNIPTIEKTASFWQQQRLPLLVLAIFCTVLYGQTVGFDYALDDLMVIQKNQFTQKGVSGIGDIFRYESFRGYFGAQTQYLEGDRYRPLSIATFAAERSILGAGSKAMSHFINVVLYILTAFLLYRVLFFLFPSEKIANSDKNTEGGISPFTSGNSQFSTLNSQFLTVPFLATALFITHPLHVEVVANIKGRDEILAFLGEIGALYFTFKYLNDRQTSFLLGAFVSFLIGIFSKESAITFLAIVPLTAYFFTNATKSDILKVSLPIFIGTVIYLLARLNAIGYLMDSKVVTDIMNNPFYGMTTGERLATIFYTLLLYLKLHIFPHPLTHDYYPFHIPKMTWANWQSLLGLALHIGLGVVILRGVKNRSVWAYAAAFYLLALSIVSNIVVSVGIFMNERFVYHASLGVCIALAYLFSQKMPRTIGWSLAVLMVVGFSAKTLMRVPNWRNGVTLNTSAIQTSPNSARANCFYAIDLWENQFLKLEKTATPEKKRALLDQIKPYFEKSIAIYPKYSSALKMWVGVSAEYHKLDGNLDVFLSNINKVNQAGVYEAFMFQYLDYLNNRTTTKADGEKLRNFYANWLVNAKRDHPTTILPQEIQKLLAQIDGRLPLLR